MIHLSRFKEANSLEAQHWFFKNIPDITDEQIYLMSRKNLFGCCPFRFFKQRDKVKVSPLWRLTLFPFFLVVLLGVLWLPFNLMITGVWGYNRVGWLSSWSAKLNIDVLS